MTNINAAELTESSKADFIAASTAGKSEGSAPTTPDRDNIAVETGELLKIHLANNVSLMLRLKNFHWNMNGALTSPLSSLLDKHSKNFFNEVEEIGRTLRLRGTQVPGSLSEFRELTDIVGRRQPQSNDGMVDDLLTCYVMVVSHAKRLYRQSLLGDEFMVARMSLHQIALYEECLGELIRCSDRRDITVEKILNSPKITIEAAIFPRL